MKNTLLINWLKKYSDKYLIIQPQKELSNTKILQYDLPRPSGIIALNIKTILDEFEDDIEISSYIQNNSKEIFYTIVTPNGNKSATASNDLLRNFWFDGTNNFDVQIKNNSLYNLAKIQAKETKSDWNTVLQKCKIDYIENKSLHLFDCLFPKNAILFLNQNSIQKMLIT
ncbi:MAG: hypothetical protein WC679_01860 [Bacteroidales bacterium]|jgi:hypothetical protein